MYRKLQRGSLLPKTQGSLLQTPALVFAPRLLSLEQVGGGDQDEVTSPLPSTGGWMP